MYLPCLIPNGSSMVIFLIQVAPCNQQGLNNLKMAKTHSDVHGGRESRILRIHFTPSE